MITVSRHWYNLLFILAYYAAAFHYAVFFFAEIMLKNMLFALHYAKLF